MMNEEIVDNSFLLDIVRSSPAYIAVINKHSLDIEYYNDQFAANICNSIKDDKELRSFKDLLDTDQQERLKAQLQEATENIFTRDKYMVYRLRLDNGLVMQVYIYTAPLRPHNLNSASYQLFILPDSSKSGLPFISFDTRELFFKQFNDIDFGTFEWLVAQDKVFWTDGIYDIYEIDRQRKNFSFTAIDKYTHPDDKEKVDEAMAAAFRDKQDIDVEYRIITDKNKVKTIHALGKVTYNSDGNSEKLIGSIKDVTAQRKNEDDLLNSVKVLHKSNKDLEEFAYVASHDLQEPLRKISTFSDRLNEKYKDVLIGDGTMYLERMMASAENMRMLINNLLEFSRISKSTVPFTHINLNFILQQVKTDLELKIEETGTIINSVQLPAISASMTQMKQLFENIINNAIKFRKQDSTPVIGIECAVLMSDEVAHYKLSDKQTYYKIQITDNGIGFEEEYATRIFQIFQRLHGKAEYPGSGIGLAICQKILEHHNGIIYAENLPGTGARFTFILPED
jgi:signal transduction histidine kinase